MKKHKLYLKLEKTWKRIVDTNEGDDAVKAAGIIYLPMIEDQEAYPAYKGRAICPDIVTRTANAMQGMVTRRDPSYHIPDSMRFLETDPFGPPIYALYSTHIRYAILMGAVLVADAPKDGGDPYLTIYRRDEALNWEYKWSNGRKTLTSITLREVRDDSDGNEIEQFRKLYLDSNGDYVQELISADGIEIKEIFYPMTAKGERLKRLPVVVHNSTNLEIDPTAPPLSALSSMAISIYQTGADKSMVEHATANPSLIWKSADAIPFDTLRASNIIHLQDTSGEAKFLEIPGNVQMLAKSVESKMNEAISMGASVTKNGPREESELAAGLRASSTTSILMSIVAVASEAMTQALRNVAYMAGEDPSQVTFEYSSRFYEEKMPQGRMEELTAQLFKGAITAEDYVAEKARYDFGDLAVDQEKEIIRIKALVEAFNKDPNTTTE